VKPAKPVFVEPPYVAVICESGDWRLSLSAGGQTYRLCARAGGAWNLVFFNESASRVLYAALKRGLSPLHPVISALHAVPAMAFAYGWGGRHAWGNVEYFGETRVPAIEIIDNPAFSHG
jgi:hypothetical protein